MKKNALFFFATFLGCVCIQIAEGQTVVRARQGFDMQIELDNHGVFGKYVFPTGGFNNDSLGFEYPPGQRIEHLYGAGLWVAGKLDTARVGTSTPLDLVSVAFEGWAGPVHEFYPGNTLADTIWKVNGRGVPRPPGWESYWGNSIPRVSVSDNDLYMCYSDTARTVIGHVPLRLKVIESSFVWADTMWEGIQIVQYKVINQGSKTIDSSYMGFFVEGDVGDPWQVSFYRENSAGYLPASRTGYITNPRNFAMTPMGLSFLQAPRPLDSLRFTFRRFAGPNTPPADEYKYPFMSTGQIDPDEYPALSDSRFVLSCGPFTIRPFADTVVVAFAFLSGQSVNQLDVRAQKARQLHQTVGVLGRNKE